MNATEPTAAPAPVKRWEDLLPKRGGKSISLHWFPTPRDFPAPGETLPQAGFVVLTSGRDRTTYAVTESPESHGRCVCLSKSRGKGTDKSRAAYVVVCDHDGTHGRCECEGWRRYGYCKHLDTVQTLIMNRWL